MGDDAVMRGPRLKFLQTRPTSAGLRHAHPSLPPASIARRRKTSACVGRNSQFAVTIPQLGQQLGSFVQVAFGLANDNRDRKLGRAVGMFAMTLISPTAAPAG